MLRSLEKCLDNFATSNPVKSVKMSVVAVVGLGRLGDRLVEAEGWSSASTSLSSLLLTSKDSDTPRGKFAVLVYE